MESVAINLLFEKDFPIDKEKLTEFLNSNSEYLKFNLDTNDYLIKDSFIEYPNFQLDFYDENLTRKKDAYFNFLFTEKPYINNYFFEALGNFVPFSFYEWENLTNLPKTNGVVYFIVWFLSLNLKESSFRHNEKTGCLYDFNWDKTGIDLAMRQAGLCSDCLRNLQAQTPVKGQDSILADIRSLMNKLSESSKWNEDILLKIQKPKTIIQEKRKSKKPNEIHVFIATPSDLLEERELLLNTLERKFRVDQYERLCKHRLVIHGWEDLATQQGYGQDIINALKVSEADIVLAVFKHKLGTPTIHEDGSVRAESGTVEELMNALDSRDTISPLGMLYFYSTPPNMSFDSENFEKALDDWKKLKTFKTKIQNKVLYKPYTNGTELLELATKDISKNIMDHFL